MVAITLTARILSGFTARQSLCRVACKISVRYHPSHAIQGPCERLLPIPTQRFFARTTPPRPLIFASRASDPGQIPLDFLSFIMKCASVVDVSVIMASAPTYRTACRCYPRLLIE
jgi:hypothetical protein